MKMSQELFECIKNDIEKLTKNLNLNDIYEKYQKDGLSDTRFYFDVFHMAKCYERNARLIILEGLQDSHIETGICKIIKGLLNEKQS